MERRKDPQSEHLLQRLVHGLGMIFSRLKVGMQVFALVGSSGTGKSFRARLVADRYQIRFIIDDGLLIKDKRILAGRSAKRESAYLAAVKTAIFADYVHRYEVRQALERNRCRRILVLATSERMIQKICNALGIPQPQKTIFIHELASPEEIQKAVENRKLYGRHVIPVPVREVRRTSAHIVTDEIKLWSRWGIFQTDRVYEKTLVRPEFSTGALIQAPDSILKQAVRNALEASIPGARLGWFKNSFDMGYFMELTVWIPRPEHDSEEAEGTKPPSDQSDSIEPRGIGPLPRLHNALLSPSLHMDAMEALKRLIVSHLEKQTGVRIREIIILMRTFRSRR